MTDHECDCSEDYGPCEEHMIVLAQREGSSARSADQLVATYLDDALAIDPECLSPYGLDVKARFDAALSALDPFSSWIDDRDLAEEASAVAHQVESYIDARTDWDDGYVIYRVNGGPLADDAHPLDCGYCAAGEGMAHNYETPQED